MKIQIDGVGTHNKGAELMLRAIIQRFNPQQTKLSIGKGSVKTEELPGLNLYRNPIPSLTQQLLYLTTGISNPRVRKSKVDLLLDSSGFKYGDFWDNKRSWAANIKESIYLRYQKKNGARIIFLPQAYGPFSTSKAKFRIKNLVKNADTVFYRDMTSKEYLEKAIPKGPLWEKLHYAPDFTGSFKPADTTATGSAQGKTVGIIPNCKMVESACFNSLKAYIDFLSRIVIYYQDLHYHVQLINHTGAEDNEVIKGVYKNIGVTNNVSIVRNENAFELKKEVGKCDFVISSRFHGVINALSQGIPTICIGWSHKYQRIMEDYNAYDYYVPMGTAEEMFTHIATLSENQRLVNVQERIKKQAIHWFEKIEQMWQKVDQTIQS